MFFHRGGLFNVPCLIHRQKMINICREDTYFHTIITIITENLYFYIDMETIVNLTQAAIAPCKGATRAVLTDVDLSISSGEVLYIIGRVGSGKSSLLAALYGEIPLLAGRGMVCGVRLDGLSAKQIPMLRRSMGIIFQQPMLIASRSVWDNLEFMLRSTRQMKSAAQIGERIDQLLEIVGMGWAASRRPNELSGGEAQKIAIARALLLRPTLVIADEPTGNLDPASAQNIIELLDQVAQMGTTVIIASHNIAGIRQTEARAMMCQQGQLIPYNQSIANQSIANE